MNTTFPVFPNTAFSKFANIEWTSCVFLIIPAIFVIQCSLDGSQHPFHYFSVGLKLLYVSRKEHRQQVFDSHQSFISSCPLSVRYILNGDNSIDAKIYLPMFFAKANMRRKINNESSMYLKDFYRSYTIINKYGNEF